jgi:DNA-directed RNA polymerase specialized sigma24 family protein
MERIFAHVPCRQEPVVTYDDAPEGATPAEYGAGLSQSMFVPLDLEVDFEAFYLGHHEVFHAYAEVHFGNRETAEEVIHEVFLEIHAGWSQLLSAGNLEQGAWAIVRRIVHNRLDAEGRGPAFVINDACVVPRNQLAARPRPHVAGSVGDEHMQALGRANRIENLDAEALLEPAKQRLG